MELYHLSEEYVPKLAIVNYASGDGRHYYLESHDIGKNQQGNYVLLEGKPMKLKTIQTLVNALAKQSTSVLRTKGLLPKNLIYFNQQAESNTLIWYVPEQKHNLFFTKDLSIPSGQAYTPTLLFVLKDETLSVFALKGKKKPNNTTKLYQAPFHNIYENGNVCLGTAKKPSTKNTKLIYFDEIMKAWEHAFWASEFSHLLGKNPIKSNLNTLYKKLILSEEKFPPNELKPHTELATIEKLLKSMNQL